MFKTASSSPTIFGTDRTFSREKNTSHCYGKLGSRVLHKYEVLPPQFTAYFSTFFDRTSQLFQLPTIFGVGHLFLLFTPRLNQHGKKWDTRRYKRENENRKNGYEFASIRITSLIQMAILYGATTSTPNEVIGIPECPFMTRFGRFNIGWGPGHQHIVCLCVCASVRLSIAQAF